jgi:hypothetical protein
MTYRMNLNQDKFDLTLLTIELAPMIKNCLGGFPKQACDLNLCNLFTWGSLYKLHIFVWNGAFVLYNPRYHYIAFPFCYDFEPQELAGLVRDFRSVDPKTEMILFPPEWLEKHPDATEYFRFRTHEAWSDYIYLSEKLYTLTGKKLAKKKNLLSQFKRQFPDYIVLPITKADEAAILNHFKHWQTDRDIKDPGLTMEYKAVQRSFQLWEDLPLEGLKLLIGDEIVAWTIFSPQTEDMVTIHFEKFDPTLKGCAQAINWETAKYVKDRFIYINREQDMGIEGLRQAKRSYEPEYMMMFHTSRLKT